MKKGKIEIARQMRDKDFDIQTIIELTGLSREEIADLQISKML